jgi:hypothetical protein
VPPGWWHAVINIDSSVAVTHNVLRTATLRDAIARGAAAGLGRIVALYHRSSTLYHIR